MSEGEAVKNFVAEWKERGSEKSDAHLFWLALLRTLGVERPEIFIQSEVPVNVDEHSCFIDIFIPSTKVLIENKSRGIDPDKPARQSDGKFLTPFEQALRYADARAYSQRPRWIVVCNFVELRVYDMDRYHRRQDENYQPNIIQIERLPHEFSRLNFLIDPNDENVDPALKISKQAGELVGDIYRSFGDVDPVELNKLCVRLVFCLYAEDSFIFAHDQFSNYLRHSNDRGQALSDLFKILNLPEEKRSRDLKKELAAFPYVNGDLFAESSDIPAFNRSTTFYLLTRAKEFDWSGISPTIFGALFESTLNPSTRRTKGMHYTSPDNIHKVIDPLFLDELNAEFKTVKRKKKNKRRALEEFQRKISELKFFDPACGSGNFLTETYLSLRRLENEVIRELYKLGAQCSILVSIENFYGLEINDFAVAVARTALWIAENQMMQETEMIIHEEINFLPLTSAAHIVEGNALRLDWNDVVPRGVDYIIGNPPFAGYSFQSPEQKSELLSATGLNNRKLDYVVGWYYKAADFMQGSDTRAAFVSTNSICQGEQTAAVWKKLFETVHIDFARRTFKWQSESEDMATVYCIIVGFSVASNDRSRIIFDGEKKFKASNINAYLLNAPNYFVEKRTTPICDVPRMRKGSQPTDGGNLIIEADELEKILRAEPTARKYIRKLLGAEEFINSKERWCLWLVEATEDDLLLPLIAERLEGCRRFRLSSKKEATRAWAARPHLFTENRQPTTNFILVPRVSGERRRYIPMNFLTPDVIVSDANLIIPDADLYHFGVLESSVHMAWMRTTAGYLGTSYRYSASIVYNNFPWCVRSTRIEETAQSILDARARYPTWTLAALYDPMSMPEELRAAHLENDLAVLDAYGFDESLSEAEIVGRLMNMYQRLL